VSPSLKLLEPVQHYSDFCCTHAAAGGGRLPQAHDSHSVGHKVEAAFNGARGVEERFFDNGRRAHGEGWARCHRDAHESRSGPRHVDELLALVAPDRMMSILEAIGDLVFCARLRERLDVDRVAFPGISGGVGHPTAIGREHCAGEMRRLESGKARGLPSVDRVNPKRGAALRGAIKKEAITA